MAQDDILGSFAEGGMYVDYLMSEIKADFLDTDDDEDIATSSRQKSTKTIHAIGNLKATYIKF